MEGNWMIYPFLAQTSKSGSRGAVHKYVGSGAKRGRFNTMPSLPSHSHVPMDLWANL